MAITITSKGSLQSTSNTNTYTATITAPTTNRIQLAFVLNSKASAADSPSSLVSTGLTWTKITEVAFGTITTGLRKLSVWRAAGTSSDTTVDITFPANQTGCAASFVEVAGGDETGIGGVNLIADNTVANVDDGTTLATLNLGGIVFTGDAVIAAFGLDTTSVITPQEGFTEVHDLTFSNPSARLQTEYHLTYDTTPTATWTASNSGGVALELKTAENAFKSNPKPGELSTVTDGTPTLVLVNAPVVIPLQSDTITLTDTPTVERWMIETLATVNLLDMPHAEDVVTVTPGVPTITQSPESVWAIPAEDVVTLTDIALVTGLIVLIPSDDLLTVTDVQPVVVLAGAETLAINVSETITLTDIATPNLVSQPQHTDGLTLTDTHKVTLIYTPHGEDATTLTDSPTVHLLLGPQAADTLTLTDTLSITGLTLIIPAADSITISEFTQQATTGTLPVENFDDNARNTSVWDTDYGDPLVTVNETAHHLEVTPRANHATDAYNGYRSVEAFDLTDTGAFVEVVQVANVATSAQTALILTLNSTNSYSILQEEGTLYFQDTIAAVTNSTTVAYNAATHRWWRIRHVSSGNTIRFETSPSGTPGSWTEQRNIAGTISVSAMRIMLEAGTYASVASPGVAIFDNVNATTLTAFPTESLTLTDTRTVTLVYKPQAVEAVTLTDAVSVYAGAASGLQDNFNDNSQNTALWSKQSTFDTTTTDALVTVNETNQRLEVTPRTVAGFAFNGYRSAKVYNLSDSAVHVSVLQVTSNTALTALVAAVDNANHYSITWDGGNLLFQDVVDSTEDNTSVTYNSSVHRWWRIRHVSSDDTIRFETSIDGVAWTQRRSIARVLDIISLRLGIEAGTYQSEATPGAAIFDSFNIPGVSAILGVPVGDQVTLTDIAEVEPITLIADTVTVLDSSLVNLLNMPHSADVVTISHAAPIISLVSISDLTISVADVVTLTETPTVNLLDMPNSAETVTITDARQVVVTTVTGPIITHDDLVTLTDTGAVNLLDLPHADDLTTLSDGITVTLIDTMLAADTVTMTDQAATHLLLAPQTADVLTLTDTLGITGLTVVITQGDLVTLSDEVRFGMAVSQADLITIGEACTIGLVGAPRVGDVALISDAVSVWAGFRGADLVTVTDRALVFCIGGIVTQPTVVVAGELRDLTKTIEVSLATVSADLRDFSKVAATRMTNIAGDVRDLTKVMDVSLAQVVADVRDLSKVA